MTSIVHHRHNSETGEFIVYSIHDQRISFDLSGLNLTGDTGFRLALLIAETVRGIESAAYVAGKKQTMNAIFKFMDDMWDKI